LREILENTSKKNINPPPIHAMTFNHEKPDEDSSIELPLKSNITPAKVQTTAASKRSMRFETLNFKDISEFTLFC
jgi:hypothetical protein